MLFVVLGLVALIMFCLGYFVGSIWATRGQNLRLNRAYQEGHVDGERDAERVIPFAPRRAA